MAISAGPADQDHRIARIVHAYGDADDATIRRTLGWAVHFGLMFLLLGESDEPTYGSIGRRAIANAVDYSRTL